MREWLSNLRDRRRTTRKRLEKIFSRDVLGSVLVSVSAGKVVEKVIVLAAPSTVARLVGWFGAFWLFVGLFVYWERVAETVEEATSE